MINTFTQFKNTNDLKKEGIFMNNNFNAIINETTNTDCNVVEVAGKVVNKYTPSNGKVTILTITSSDGMKINAIKVVCFGSQNAKAVKEINEGDFVFVKGNIQSCLRDNGKITYSIFCDSIFAEEELKQELFGSLPSKNRMYIYGELVGIQEFKGKNVCNLFVHTCVNGRTSVFPVSFYGTVPDLAEGDRISVFGNVQSVKKVNYYGSARYYENYVAFQIKKENCNEFELSAFI